MKGYRVLVTGGEGFIGSHLCSSLAKVGAEVEAWVRPGGQSQSRPSIGVEGRVTFKEVELRNVEMVKREAARVRPHRVFHLAGRRTSRRDAAALRELLAINVLGMLNLLQAVGEDCFVVVAGSCEEYGRSRVPFKESYLPRPLTPYALTKTMATLACQMIETPRTCVARLSVVYGPGQRNNMFIPSLIRASLMGQDFPMTKGGQTRDFVYVGDVVAALIALAECDRAAGQTVNIGSGVEHRIKDVGERILRLVGSKTKLLLGSRPQPLDEAQRYVCSIDKLRRITGWEPRVGLDKGLALTVEWGRRAPTWC